MYKYENILSKIYYGNIAIEMYFVQKYYNCNKKSTYLILQKNKFLQHFYTWYIYYILLFLLLLYLYYQIIK